MEKIEEFLAKDPKTLSQSDKRLWFKYYNQEKKKQNKTKQIKQKILSELGYNQEFIGYKDNKTGKVISTFSNIYAKNNNKEFKFSSADAYDRRKHQIEDTQSNYGYIQKEMSNVLWIDLDCHNDGLFEDYQKIREWFFENFKHHIVHEDKNNGKGTHIWFFFDTDMESKRRRYIQTGFQQIASNDLNISLDNCKKIIDMPKAWFRIPGTNDYRNGSEFEFYNDLYEDIILARARAYKMPKKPSIAEDKIVKLEIKPFEIDSIVEFIQTNKDTHNKPTNNNEIAWDIMKNGLSIGQSYEQLGQLVPFLFHKFKTKDVDYITSIVKQVGGNANVLDNEGELKSRIAYLVKGLKFQHIKSTATFEKKQIDVNRDWKDCLSLEQRKNESIALDLFIKQHKKMCANNGISKETLMNIMDSFICNYATIKDTNNYQNLSGNMSPTWIRKHLGVSDPTGSISNKIIDFMSNLYGLHLVIDKDGKFFTQGYCERHVILDSNQKISTGNTAYSYIGKSISKFVNETIKLTKIRDLDRLTIMVDDINGNLDNLQKSTQDAINNYKVQKQLIYEQFAPKKVKESDSYENFFNNIGKPTIQYRYI